MLADTRIRLFLDGAELTKVLALTSTSLVREMDVVTITTIDDENKLMLDRYIWFDGHEVPTDGMHDLVTRLPGGRRIEMKCEGCRMDEEHGFRPALRVIEQNG